MRHLLEGLEENYPVGVLTEGGNYPGVAASDFAKPKTMGWPCVPKRRALTAIQFLKSGFRAPKDPGELAALKKNVKKICKRLYKNDKEVMAALKSI